MFDTREKPEKVAWSIKLSKIQPLIKLSAELAGISNCFLADSSSVRQAQINTKPDQIHLFDNHVMIIFLACDWLKEHENEAVMPCDVIIEKVYCIQEPTFRHPV